MHMCVFVCPCVAVYDVSGAASDRNCVVLSDIHIDIMDYIQPASCTDAEFRQMWAEFEWENKVITVLEMCEMKILCRFCKNLTCPLPSPCSLKVTVNTNITELNEYLQHILSSTNMKCLTPEKVKL